MAEQLSNNASTTVASGLANVTNPVTFVVASAGGFPTSGNFRILVEAEILLVTAVAGTSFTASRAQEGTSAASHANGKAVTHILTAAGLQALMATFAAAGFTINTVAPGGAGISLVDFTAGIAPRVEFRNNTGQVLNIALNGTGFSVFNAFFQTVLFVDLGTGSIQIVDNTKAFPNSQNVTFGAANSGGSGFKVMRIPN